MPNDEEYTPQPQRRRGPGPGGPGGGMVGGEKPDDFGKAMNRLLQFSKSWIPVFLIAGVCSIVGSVMSLIGPGKLSEITDLITAGLTSTIDVDAVAQICFILVILYGIGWACNLASGLLMAQATQSISRDLRSRMSKKINSVPLKYFDTTTTGNIMSRISNDVDMIGQTLNQSVGTLISAIAMLVGSLFCMFSTNWIMAVAAILSSLLGFVIIFAIVGHSQKYFNAQQEELGSLNGLVEETYSGHSVVRAYNAEEITKAEFVANNNRLYDAAWKSQFLSGLMQPLMGFVGNLGYVVVCIVGAVLTMNGVISFGVIVAFMMYVRQFTQPLSQLAQAATSLQSAAAATERVSAFLDEVDLTPDKTDAVTLDETNGNVTFDHVKFGYDPDKIIIKDFSAEAKSGQKIAIVGPTGAGKTTLVNLLMRFYELNGGNILIDGTKTTDMTRASVHDQFCMVLQDTWIFEGTIKENIVYSEEGVTDEQIVEACKAVGLHHFITTLPKGYDTVLNDSTSLSAGQRQLVTIARAMIRNAPMLILDEATSSVDTRTEQLIQNAMDKLMVGRTSFVIAHRLSTIRNANLILVMQQGEIVESGTHDELLAKNGPYADLYNSQFEE